MSEFNHEAAVSPEYIPDIKERRSQVLRALANAEEAPDYDQSA